MSSPPSTFVSHDKFHLSSKIYPQSLYRHRGNKKGENDPCSTVPLSRALSDAQHGSILAYWSKSPRKTKMPILLRPVGRNNTIGKIQTLQPVQCRKPFPQDRHCCLPSRRTRTINHYNYLIPQDILFVKQQYQDIVASHCEKRGRQSRCPPLCVNLPHCLFGSCCLLMYGHCMWLSSSPLHHGV